MPSKRTHNITLIQIDHPNPTSGASNYREGRGRVDPETRDAVHVESGIVRGKFEYGCGGTRVPED
jgi:hypothetical protein